MEYFERRGFGVSILSTGGSGHARELAARAASEGVETVVVIGGDGTVNEVVNGLLASGAESLPRLGIVPAGSSNDLSKSLRIPQKVKQACERILDGRTKRIDVGQVALYDKKQPYRAEPSPRPSALRLPPSNNVREGRDNCVDEKGVGTEYFCSASSVGLFADVAAESFRIKRLTGSVRYLAAALRVVRRMGDGWRMRVDADGRVFEGDYGVLLVSNAPRFGGLTLMPEAKCDDGLFDCLLVEMPTKAEALRLMLLALRGRLKRHRKVVAFRAESLDVSLDRPARLCNDGEVHSDDSEEVRYGILPRRLEMIC